MIRRRFRVVDSPLGPLTLTWDDEAGAVRGVHVHDQRSHDRIGSDPDPAFGEPDDGACAALDALAGELDEYFAGTRRTFTLPVDPPGTPFAREVWAALREVPYGATTTYGALAAAVGRPRAAQAVGTANARNPVSLLVPCHRVLTAAGLPSGGGPGVARKRLLQEWEHAGGSQPLTRRSS
ncbi:methylated-DNA--[protein]-cysteine S-methyltransferase [Actinomycetospora cinnamomea]|uniref:Methylated-DNA-[protein]-cysteine S-methyltransferase n=1 Tax=Actinomycetospora cinnamomea TaxID=663609 RepID=A0A2U1FIR4_9PSEU|nr:methylated-DNA--[protein]-cysteine S-methyltransferase [Actinomycetospora cinnamomea]PVZ12072.1 methylated-DNA-[protein]-cysteine S-methyltransferase [Actinomycetospora cinnamomea]